MVKKGSAEERDLVHKLWSLNFAAMRAPASGGATKKPLPDVLAGNSKIYLAIEVKTTTKDKLYIENGHIGDEQALPDSGLKQTMEAARTVAVWRITKGNALP